MSDHADIDKHVRTYILVFVALMAFTVITVAVSYLHLPLWGAITLALTIATVKAALVACYFMHLISEKTLIYAIVAFALFNFAGLLLITLYENYYDLIEGTTHVA